MSHTASTTISRYFTITRGKALSISWFGLSSAEFILPILMVYLLTIIDWRNLWLIFAIISLLVLPVVSFLLIKNLKLDSREINDENVNEIIIKQWKRIEVIKDYRFYIVCLNMIAMPWIFTGFAVFQSFIQTSKGWGPYIVAQSFMSYSILSVLTLFVSGFLIDKFTSRKLLIYMNIPLLIAVIILFFFDSSITAFIFLGLVGISNGFANILGSSTWAELYGVKHLGSIKALTTALMVFATAFGTALFGFLIDIGFSVSDIATVSGAYIFSSLMMLFLIRKKLNPIII